MPDIAPGNAATNATVALRLAEAFRRHGVTLTFGQSLPSAFHLACPAVGIEQKVYRQENAGGAMADGYARISRKVGVVTAQNGPAATLLVPPLAEALKASIPVLALVQEVTRDAFDRNAFQELDHIRMFEPVAKWVRRLDRADRLDDYVDMAFTAAASGRPGPAVLLVPADLLTETAAERSSLLRPRTLSLGRVPLDRTLADPAAVSAAAEALAAARHPLVVAGGGVHLSGATAELAALQEAAHLPVATTVMGKGAADETHPLTLGVIGYVMGRGARTHALRAMVERADLVLLVGNRTNQNGTDSWRLFSEGTRFIHLDADPMEIGRNYEAMRLVGDAGLTLAALTEALRARDLSARAAARAGIEHEIAEAVAGWRRTIEGVTTRDAPPCRPERVMAELDRLIGPEDVVVADASYASIWVANYLTARRAGQRFLTPRGIAGLGWGLPMAIGARIALDEAGGKGRVVCLCGDGGFGHSWAELEMLRRLELPVTLIILNNGILGYQKHAEEVKFGEHTIAVNFTAVDHAAIARACGVEGHRVEGGAAIGPALRAALQARRPVLLDVITDPDARPPISVFAGHYPEPF
ncbi:acetolactate synthase catalytic subunit [Crenalkalicoccus roseus]|uniref:acetolactate synthase catalytic subunit n=1 Tax=Crenalkalicoccus roseus TaxID=1485588 RepID=UPI001080F01F|nr:acetolactate synthase catalytic subunit [Crenalkalicoccus roseus]